jgi:hypothetical protein
MPCCSSLLEPGSIDRPSSRPRRASYLQCRPPRAPFLPIDRGRSAGVPGAFSAAVRPVRRYFVAAARAGTAVICWPQQISECGMFGGQGQAFS